MKKFLAVLLTIVVIGTVLIACSKEDESETTDAPKSTGIVTEEAKIKSSEAIDFIATQYTEKELGLDKLDKQYQFMIAQTGVEINGEKYVKVVANVPIKNDELAENGQETFTMETYGEYCISFDGKTVLIRDMETGEYSELENRYDAYAKSTTAPVVTDADKK